MSYLAYREKKLRRTQYSPSIPRGTCNALVTLVKAEQDCFVLKNCLKLSTSYAGSLSSSGCSEFQTVGLATGKARGRPSAVRVESTARHNEPVSVGGT